MLLCVNFGAYLIYGKCIAMFGGPRASMRKARDPGYYRAAAACHDTMKLLRRLVAMLTASGAARAADPLPAGVHESQMAVCGAAPQTFWFQQFGGGGDGHGTRPHSAYQRALAEVHLRGSATVGSADRAALESLCRGWAQPATFR